MDERSALLGRLTRVLATTAPQSPFCVRLALAFSGLLHAEGGAIVFGEAAADRVTLCATDGVAARLEDVQDVLREGPTIEALTTGVPSGALDLADQRRRWPMLVDNLATGGEELLLHAFPMRADMRVLGALTVYLRTEGPLPLSLSDAQFLADAVGVAVLGQADRRHPGSDETWRDRDRVAQATGMVVAQLRVPPGDAMAVLRAHAFAHASTVAAVSRLVVERELDFSPGDGAS